MRFAPYASEAAALASMTAAEVLEYLLSRTGETEEIWGLASREGWIMRDSGQETSLPVWPYQQLARDCARDEWAGLSPEAISLEHFVYNTLPLLMRRGIRVELMPRPAAAGQLIDAQQLRELYDGLIDTGEYTLEG